MKNLDTGEEMDLVKAEDQLPESINPLSLHIMRLTSEYCVRLTNTYFEMHLYTLVSLIKLEYAILEVV